VVAIGQTGIAGLFRRLSHHDSEIIDAWLEHLGLAALSKQAYARLSRGKQRKTLITKAMFQQPKILMLDEPTATASDQCHSALATRQDDRSVAAGYLLAGQCPPAYRAFSEPRRGRAGRLLNNLSLLIPQRTTATGLLNHSYTAGNQLPYFGHGCIAVTLFVGVFGFIVEVNPRCAFPYLVPFRDLGPFLDLGPFRDLGPFLFPCRALSPGLCQVDLRRGNVS